MLRDYKTGRAPQDDGGIFRGGRQLQIPFYVLAAAKLFPGEVVVERLPRLRRRRPAGGVPPRARDGPEFRALLRDLVDLVAQRRLRAGADAPATSATSRWCAGRRACCSAARLYKLRDAALQAYLRLRDIG